MTIETRLSEDEQPAVRCPYCDRPFPSESLQALHIGEQHALDSTEEERAAYDAAYEAESDELFLYHLKVIAALILLYGAFTLLYTVAWT